jgi:hypothetical protein
LAIFIVKLLDLSNGFNSHLVQFHPFYSCVSISKMVLENFPVLDPLKTVSWRLATLARKFLVFRSVLIPPYNNLARFTSISAISNIRSPSLTWK